MIPKRIHYCWFGRNPKPELFYKCYKSWKKYCKDYEIIEWNEENFDISLCPLYIRQAYEEGKWAFVTDYVRLKVVYDHGGVYLDTDVELKKRLEKLLRYNAFFGFEDGKYINTGLGFGSTINNPILKELMDDYNEIAFIKENGTYDLTPCPQRNTQIFDKYGLIKNDSFQILSNDIVILPSVYLCPISYNTGKFKKSFKTISIHWFNASWQNEKQKKMHENHLKIKKQEKIDYLIHTPNRIAIKIFGVANYNKIKKSIKLVVKK